MTRSPSIRKAAAVRDHIPLEQGLRPSGVWRPASGSCVRDHIPLEQGLRPDYNVVDLWNKLSETIFH